MTEQDFIKQISSELTISGSLPAIVPEAEFKRIIFQAKKWFENEYPFAVQKHSYVIQNEAFNNPQFRNSRQLQLPECVVSVVEFKEINGIGRLGNIDRDFSEERLMASEIFVSSMMGDDLVTRLAQYSYFDLSRAFFLEQIAYDFNKNTKILKVEGRDPKFDVFLDTWSVIGDDKLFDDLMFIRYCTCMAKLSYARLVGLYDYQLPGGVKINGEMLRSEAEAELEQIKEKIKSDDVADWFFIYH